MAVVIEEQQSGTGSGTSVTTSTTLTVDSEQKYFAFIGSKIARAVTSVTGMGLTWTLVEAQCSGRSQTEISVWEGTGTPSSGTITANFTASTESAVIVAYRMSGVNTTTPVLVSEGANTNGEDDPASCTGGTDDDAPSLSLDVQEIGSLILGCFNIRSSSFTPGTGYVLETDVQADTGGDASTVTIESKTSTATGATTVDASLGSNTDWSLVAVEFGAVGAVDHTFDVDALIKAIQTFNFTVDGIILDSPEKVFLVDGLVQETFTEDFTVDAFIQILDQEETFTIDVFTQATQTFDFTVDAFTQATQTFDFTVDAFLQATQTFDFTVDAFTQQVKTETFTIDAFVQDTFTFDFTVDAFAQAEQIFNFTVDALIQGEITEFFLIDGFVLETFTNDFDIDGLVQETFTEDFTVNAIVVDRFDEDFDIDAFVQELNNDEDFLIDGLVQALNQEETFTVDGFPQATFTKDFTVDAFVLKTQTETFTVDGFPQATFTEDFTIDAFIQKLDNDKTFLVDAQIAIRPEENFDIDGLILDSPSELFLVDTLAQAENEKMFLVDGLVQTTFTEDFIVDALTLGTKIKEFFVDARILQENDEDFFVDVFIQILDQEKEFEVDALILKTGDSLCGINHVFTDDITTSAGWSTTGTQILVDDGSFPNVIRMECLQSFQAGGTQQVVKALTRSIPNHRTGIVWEFDHDHLGECNTPKANAIIELTETSASDEFGNQPALRYRIFHSGSSTFVRAEFSDGVTDILTGTFDITTPVTIFPRVSIVNDGNDLRLEIFSDSGRTTLVSSISDVDITSLDGKELAFIQVANVGTAPASPQRQLRGELDNFDLKADLCPKFEIDALLEDSNTANAFVDALIQTQDIDKTFLVDAIILEEQEKTFTVDARVQDTFTFDFTVDAKVAVGKLFTVDAQIVRLSTFTVDAILPTTVPEDFTVDGITFIFPSELFLIDALIQVLDQEKTFTVDAELEEVKTVVYDIDGLVQELDQEETFIIDGLLPVVNTETFEVDARIRNTFTKDFTVNAIILKEQIEEFTVDAVLNKIFTKDFTVNGIILATQTASFTIDTFSELEKTKDFTIDVVLEQEKTKPFTISAIVIDTFVKDFTIDGLIFGVIVNAGQFEIDAFVQETQTDDFTVDGIVIIVPSGLTSIDGLIQALDNDEDFTIDAKVINRETETFDVDAQLIVPVVNTEDFEVDAIVKALGDNGNCPTPATQTIYSVASTVFGGVDNMGGSGGQNTRQGLRILASQAGNTIKDVRWNLSRTVGATGNCVATVRNKGDDIIATSPVLDVTTITATPTPPSLVFFTFDKFITLEEGDRVLIEFSGVGTLKTHRSVFGVPSGFQRTFFDSSGDYNESTLNAYGAKFSNTVFSAEDGNQHGCAEVDAQIAVLDNDEDFTVDGSIGGAQEIDFTVDARVISLTQTEIFTVDAQIFLPTLANFTVDGFLIQPVSLLNFTVDAELEEIFTQGFTIDSILTGAGQKVFLIDGLTLGTQILDFTVDADVRNIKTTVFDVDAIIKLTGDVLCTGTGVVFSDSIPNNSGWTTTGSAQVFVDSGFPNVIRLECFQSRLHSNAQTVKSLGVTLDSRKDLVWEFKHRHLSICVGALADAVFALTETSTITDDILQGAIKFRTTHSFPANTDQKVRAEILDSSGGSAITSEFNIGLVDATFFPRVSILSGGTLLRLEIFSDSARTNLLSSIPDVDITSVNNENINFIQVSPIGGGGPARQAREEFDDILINAGRCPNFLVDAKLLGEEEKTFTVDAVISTIKEFTVDALILLSGDIRCAGGNTILFQDDFTTNVGWFNNGGSSLQIDTPTFPNQLRINKLLSRTFLGIVKATKSFSSPLKASENFIWEFTYVNLPGGTPFASEFNFDLKEDQTDVPDASADQTTIRFRTDVIPSTGPEFLRLEAFGKNGATFASSSPATALPLTNNITYFPRITKTGNFIKLELFTDSGRTIQETGSPLQIDVSTLDMSQDINAVYIGNYSTGGSARQIEEFIDDIVISQSLCPQFTVDAFLGIPEIEFTVDAVLATQDKFTIDGLVQALGDNDCTPAFFFDTIDDDTPWTVVGGAQIVVNEGAGIIEWNNLTGGGTTAERYAHREIPNFDDDEGELRIRIKVNKTADSAPTAPSGRFMVLQNNDLHPNPSTGSSFQIALGTTEVNGAIFAQIGDGTNTVVTSPRPIFPNGTTKYLEAIYNPVGQTLTMNIYTDAGFSVHDTGSPIQVDASSISMTGLTFTHLVTSNVKNSGPGRRVTADLDDFQIGIGGCPTFDVDSIVKAFDTEKTFTVDAEITRGKIFLVDSIVNLIGEEQFIIDAKIAFRKEFAVDGELISRFEEEFLIDGATLGTIDKDFTVDGITIIFPSGLMLIDAIILGQNTEEDFTVDSFAQATQTFDFTVDSQLVQDEIPKQFTIDGRLIVIRTTTFDIDGIIKLAGENGTCNFFPGTNLTIDTGLEQFIGPIQPVHEIAVEQLTGQEVTLSNQQVRSVSFLLRSSNFPNEITTSMPIDAQVWSGVAVGNLGGEITEAVSTTVINASNTSGDLPPGDWTLVKFEFNPITTPFLTGDFVVGYRSLSSVDDPAGVGTAIPVISNSNVIPGSAVHRKGSNSALGDLDEWIFLAGDQKDMVIQLEVVNGDEIILGEGKQCPPVDAILVNNPAEPLIDAVLVDRPQVDFIIDGLTAPFPVPFEVDGILVGTQIQFTIDAQIVPQLATFLIDGLITDAGQKLFLVDASIFGQNTEEDFLVDTFIQALSKDSPKFNINALLFVRRTKDFTVDGTTKFLDQVAPFTIDALVIFFPSQLPTVDGLVKGEPIKFFFADAFIQRLNNTLFPFTDVDALIQTQNTGKSFLVDGLIVGDKEEDFTIDARLSTPALAPTLFSVDAQINLQNGRWQIDGFVQQKSINELFLADVLIVANPQKLFLVDGITIGSIDEEFTIDVLLKRVDIPKIFRVDAIILQVQTIDYTVDAIVKDFGVTVDFTVDSILVRRAEYFIDSFVQALGDGVLGNGNNGGTNDKNSTNPYVQQPTDDNTITLPIGTLVGQRLRLPTAPVRVTDYTFVIHRAGTAGTPMGTLTGKIYKNSIGGNSISGADLIATSDNVVNLASITTNTNGQNVQFTFTNPPEITVDDNVFLGFDIAGSNEQMFLHTESTGTAIAGGDVNIESTGTWGADLGVDAVLTANIDIATRQRASALMHAFVGIFIQEIIGVDGLVKAIGGISPSPLGEAEFTVSANIRFKRIEEFKVDAILIGSQDFTVSAFVGDTLFTGLEVESVIVENNSTNGVESVIVENNSDSGVESVIGHDT